MNPAYRIVTRLRQRDKNETRRNTMEIDGYRAVIQFDPDIEMFRGEFVDLNGGADFYARDVSGLRREGATSLRVFLDMCAEDGVEPGRRYSGRFNVRIPSELHADVAAAAAAEGKSLNQWVTDTLGDRVAPGMA
jgi:predicted HicB family RNase H-like nuclease